MCSSDLTEREAIDLVELAREKSLFLMEAMWTRCLSSCSGDHPDGSRLLRSSSSLNPWIFRATAER